MSLLTDALADASSWTDLSPKPGMKLQTFRHTVAGKIQAQKDDDSWNINVYQPDLEAFYYGFSIPRSSRTSGFWSDLDVVSGPGAQQRLQHLSDTIWAWALSQYSIPLDADISLTRWHRAITIGRKRGYIKLPEFLHPVIKETDFLMGVPPPSGSFDPGLSDSDLLLVGHRTRHARLDFLARCTPPCPGDSA